MEAVQTPELSVNILMHIIDTSLRLRDQFRGSSGDEEGVGMGITSDGVVKKAVPGIGRRWSDMLV